MTNYYNSGLGEVSFYSRHRDEYPFYTTHCPRDYFSDSLTEQEIAARLLEKIKYDLPLVAQYYHNTNEVKDALESALTANLHRHYYEPLIWDEKTALECDLLPFQFGGMDLLLPGGLNNETNFLKLEVYQLFTHNSVDENSRLFDDSCKSYISSIFKEEVAQKLLNKLSQLGFRKK